MARRELTEEERMTPAQLDEIARLLTDRDAMNAALPEAERLEYERCKRSVVESRRRAEREAGDYYVY